MTYSGAQQSLGSRAGFPVLNATWPVLRDDPQVVSAMALPISFVPEGRSTGGASRHRATALGILDAQMPTAHPSEGTDLARCLCALWAGEHSILPPAAPHAIVYADLRPLIVRAEAAILIGLAFSELLRNAFTHAFPRSGTGHVGIHLWPVSTLPDVRAFLLIADDGQGFTNEPPAASDSGIPLARRLVERCGGTLAREPGSGTVWRVALPKATEAVLGNGATGRGLDRPTPHGSGWAARKPFP